MTIQLFTGCTYLKNRGDDAREIIDLGVTVSQKPQFAFYASGPFVQVGALGVGNVDGKFVGLGEGEWRAGGPHYEKSVGLLVWGEEWISYNHSKDDLDAMSEEEAEDAANFMRVGILGMAQGPAPDEKYIVSCPHYIHLGFVGLVGTPRYLQMADFLLGWTTLDILGDDGGCCPGDEAKMKGCTKCGKKGAGKKHEGMKEKGCGGRRKEGDGASEASVLRGQAISPPKVLNSGLRGLSGEYSTPSGLER